MTFFLLSGLAVGLPFVTERYYVRCRFGIFALLFWLFVVQATILVAAALLVQSGIAANETFTAVGHFVTGVALLTIGLTPITAAVIALAMLLVWGFGRAFSSSKTE